jgi:hypothetical protein
MLNDASLSYFNYFLTSGMWHSARPARPVSGSNCTRRRALGFVTGASGPLRNRSIRSHTQRTARVSELIGRGGASGHVRPNASGRQSRSLEPLWTAIGRWHYRVRSWRGARPVKQWNASGHTLPESVTFCDRWKSKEQDSKRDTWRASPKSHWCDRTLWPRPISARRAASRA